MAARMVPVKLMAPKADKHLQYAVHGDGLGSLRGGLIAIRMPEMRRAAAIEIVRHVTESNNARAFRWYKTDGKDELCCWWDNHESNVMWIWQNHVHLKTEAVSLPPRPTTWVGEDGHVGWLLPGGLSGTGGHIRESRPPTTICPVTFIQQPAGSECPNCEVPHP